MKFIRHTLTKFSMTVLFACVMQMCSNAGSDLSPEDIDGRLPNKVIADAILQWPKEGTEFFLTYENKQCYRDGKMDMPMRHAFVFGLVPANVLFSSVVTPHETQDEDGETLYFYDAISPSARRRSTYMNSDFYYPQFSLKRCVCRIVFAHREVSPDFSYLQALTMPMKNGKCEKLSPANVWDVRGIEESKYMSEFSNRVFKICRIGFFGIPFASAVAFVNNTATRQDDAKELRIEPTPKTAHLNVLDPREISEVVYWLWKRKGKTEEYAGFVKTHPELFEPIAGEEEFRTELGRRLIGTWK